MALGRRVDHLLPLQVYGPHAGVAAGSQGRGRRKGGRYLEDDVPDGRHRGQGEPAGRRRVRRERSLDPDRGWISWPRWLVGGGLEGLFGSVLDHESVEYLH